MSHCSDFPVVRDTLIRAWGALGAVGGEHWGDLSFWRTMGRCVLGFAW